jgi:hypothetical protein
MSDSGDSSNEEWETPEEECVDVNSDEAIDDIAADEDRPPTPVDEEWTMTDDVVKESSEPVETSPDPDETPPDPVEEVTVDATPEATEGGASETEESPNPPAEVTEEVVDLNPFRALESSISNSRPDSSHTQDGPSTNSFNFLAPADPFAAPADYDPNSRPSSKRSMSSFNLEDSALPNFSFAPPAPVTANTDLDSNFQGSGQFDMTHDQPFNPFDNTINDMDIHSINDSPPDSRDTSKPTTSTPRTPPSTAAPVHEMVEDMLNDIKAICDQKSSLRRDLEEAFFEQETLRAVLMEREKELELASVAAELTALARESEKTIHQITLEKFQVISETRELMMGEKLGHLGAVVVPILMEELILATML